MPTSFFPINDSSTFSSPCKCSHPWKLTHPQRIFLVQICCTESSQSRNFTLSQYKVKWFKGGFNDELRHLMAICICICTCLNGLNNYNTRRLGSTRKQFNSILVGKQGWVEIGIGDVSCVQRKYNRNQSYYQQYNLVSSVSHNCTISPSV